MSQNQQLTCSLIFHRNWNLEIVFSIDYGLWTMVYGLWTN